MQLTSLELENLTISRYFQKEKVDRLVDFVSKKKTRGKFLAGLAHLKDLDFSKFKKVERNEKPLILEMTSQLKQSKCYVISADKRIDRTFMEIESALDLTIGYGMGTILVFGEAEMIYYEGENPGNRWISIAL